jgi:hypothetical protein
MPSGTPRSGTRLHQPHPDDERGVQQAMADADACRLLSPVASEAFLRWLEGSDDESWRGECE